MTSDPKFDAMIRQAQRELALRMEAVLEDFAISGAFINELALERRQVKSHVVTSSLGYVTIIMRDPWRVI